MNAIHARESIDAANRHAMGAGTLTDEARYRIGAQWDHAAGAQQEPGEASDADLLAMGVDPRRRRKRVDS